MALVGLILILVLVFTLLLHGHSTKYKACGTGLWLRRPCCSMNVIYRVTQQWPSFIMCGNLEIQQRCCCCCHIVPFTVNRVTTWTLHWFITVCSTKSWDIHQFTCAVCQAKLPLAVLFLQDHSATCEAVWERKTRSALILQCKLHPEASWQNLSPWSPAVISVGFWILL